MTEQEVEAVNKAAAIFPDTPREIIEREMRAWFIAPAHIKDEK